MRKGTIPYELIEALRDYLDNHPEQKDIEILSCSSSIRMGNMPDEIEQGTKIGIDYEKSLYKMAFERVIKEGKINV